jgi:hypothetical protein
MTRDVVVCSTCATPHHGACFADHQGCSMLGCESTRAADMDSPDARRVCPSCQGLSPAEAPFCAWCATPLGEESGRALRRGVIQRMPLRQYLSAAALLLSACLAVGAYFGDQQEALVQTLEQTATTYMREQALSDGRQALKELHEALRLFVEQDLDGNGVADPPADVEALQAVIDDELLRKLSTRELWQLDEWPHTYEYEFKLEVVAPGELRIHGSQRADSWSVYSLPALSCDADGQILEETR